MPSTNPHTVTTRLVIDYTDAEDFWRKFLAHAEKLGLVKGTGTLYAEGERRPFTEWKIEVDAIHLE